MFAVHWVPLHRGSFGARSDASVFRQWNPEFIKIVWDGATIPYLEDIPPDAKIVVRNYPLSEQFHGGLSLGARFFERQVPFEFSQNGSGRDLRYEDILPLPFEPRNVSSLPTPESAAEQYVNNAAMVADYCKSRGIAKERLLFEGPNEYPVWAHGYDGLARLETHRLRLMHKIGLKSVVVNLGVGWPGNDGKDRPPLWDWARSIINEMSNGDYLGLHEYWAYSGPQQNWRWWAGRLLQCPYRVPILVTECGIDGGVLGPSDAKKGWWDLPEPGLDNKAVRYVNELWQYAEALRQDGRTKGLFIYTYDGNRQDWGRFDIRVEEFVRVFFDKIASSGMPKPVEQPQPPPVVVPPQPPPSSHLPSSETTKDPAIMADKVRWWFEEHVRQREAGNTARADEIMYDLIRKDGLLYRLENALKAVKK